MPKKLIVLFDETGSTLGTGVTNVGKLCSLIETGPEQKVLYIAGAPAATGLWQNNSVVCDAWRGLKLAFDFVTGVDIHGKVLQAYKWIAKLWEQGDAVFLFGYGRGAYEARVLAAFVRCAGVVSADQAADYALEAFLKLMAPKAREFEAELDELEARLALAVTKVAELSCVALLMEADQGTAQSALSQLALYKSTLSPKPAKVDVDFVGVWDTVSSILVPKEGWYYWLFLLVVVDWVLTLVAPSVVWPFTAVFLFARLVTMFERMELPFTFANRGVKVLRHAVATDEKRVLFTYDPYFPVDNLDGTLAGDVKEVWFAGTHGDCGGGYIEPEAHLSKYPLLWMCAEAAAHGLVLDASQLTMHSQGLGPVVAPSVTRPDDQPAAAPSDDEPLLRASPRRARLLDWLVGKTKNPHNSMAGMLGLWYLAECVLPIATNPLYSRKKGLLDGKLPNGIKLPFNFHLFESRVATPTPGNSGLLVHTSLYDKAQYDVLYSWPANLGLQSDCIRVYDTAMPDREQP